MDYLGNCMLTQQRLAFEQSLSLASVVGVDAGAEIIECLYGVESLSHITEEFTLASGTRLTELTAGNRHPEVSLHHEFSRMEFKLRAHKHVRGSALGQSGAIAPQLFGHSLRDVKLSLSRMKVPSPWDQEQMKLYRSVCGGEHPTVVFGDPTRLLVLSSSLALKALRLLVNNGTGQSDSLRLNRIETHLWSGAGTGLGASVEMAVNTSKFKIFLPMTKNDTSHISENVLGWLSPMDAFRFAHGFNGNGPEGILVCIQEEGRFYTYTL